MKIIVFCLCVLALPVPLFAAEHIEVEAKVLEVNASVSSIPHDFSKLNHMEGLNLFSAPHVTTISGLRAAVDTTHDFSPASVNSDGFQPVPIGVIVDVTPEIKEGHFTYIAHVTMRDLMGVKDEGGQKVSETTTHELYFSGTSEDGEWMWIELSDTTNGKKRMVCLRFTRQKT